MSEQVNQPALHGAIVSMVSLAAGIASNHPRMGLCQLERLQGLGVPRHQIDAVIEIARHIRDEAREQLDAAFDEAWAELRGAAGEVQACCGEAEASSEDCCSDPAADETEEGCCGTSDAAAGEASCCTPTPSGQPCC